MSTLDGFAADGTWPIPSASDGPCRTWPLAADCRCAARDGTPWPEDPQEFSDEQRRAVEVATEILWRLTAGKYGLCPELVRPCRQRYRRRDWESTLRAGMPYPVPWPPLDSGAWCDIPCHCVDAGACVCGPVQELRLPGPVYWEPPEAGGESRYRLLVRIDGELLDPSAYRLFDDNRLIRVDGGSWPDCQDLTADVTEPGSFAIEYWRGIPVPPGGRRAAAVLSCEIWKRCIGDATCRLPDRVQSITREGVQYDLVDPTDYVGQGRTGLPDVDMWLHAVNPRNQRERSTVWSPDLPQFRSQRRRWW